MAVVIPVITRDILPTAPESSFSSVALVVPTTWEAVPKATPWLTGSFKRKSLHIRGPKIPPFPGKYNFFVMARMQIGIDKSTAKPYA